MLLAIFKPANESIPAIGIAINGIALKLILASLPSPIKLLPDRSPNLVTKVSIKTDDLYLSFFAKVL